MTLDKLLEGKTKSEQASFLVKAYKKEDAELADTIIDKLKHISPAKAFELMRDQMDVSASSGNSERSWKLLEDYKSLCRRSYHLGIDAAMELKPSQPEIIEEIVRSWQDIWHAGYDKLVKAGFTDRARSLVEEVLPFLERTRRTENSFSHNGLDQALLILGRSEDAVQVHFDDQDYDFAFEMIKRHIPLNDQPVWYRKLINEAKGNSRKRDHGYPISIMAAEELHDESLVMEIKKEYLKYCQARKDYFTLFLARDVGTREELQEGFDREIRFEMESKRFESIARLAGEAYKIFNDPKYASQAGEALFKIGRYKEAQMYSEHLPSDTKEALSLAIRLAS